MSQHTFITAFAANNRHDQQEGTSTAGQVATLRCGWDRRLGEFFLNLTAGEGDEAERLYDTLLEGAIYEAIEIKFICDYHGIELPADFLRTLEAEELANTGNKIVRWSLAGPVVEFEEVGR
ncbi:hypothetical protein [Hymenobacter mucosus]|uniref:Uncharacterized protein n=1 Tax=Hymenobacter mucosus TaxID=1411120 RepID=A0A239A2P5_9BACT|nr:hypothetical protein [Hymenobacter mucosus]SNR89769.1 hypothetical protein SAMN06269173_110149 [Hymenobacter mucosus]